MIRRGWWREHPLAEDAVLALAVLTIVSVIALAVSPLAPFTLSGGFPDVVWPLAAACAALLLRRRFTFVVWAVTLLISAIALSLSAQLAPVATVLVAVYTVAANSKPWASLVCAGVSVGVLAPLALLMPTPFNSWVAFSLAAWIGMATAVGVAVRGQRDLVRAAEARAAAAEASHRQGELRAVAEERVRIARDLHDLVAHHIAVINVQAGVARHVLTSDPAAAAAALTEVRNAAQGALNDTSLTLGLLRNSGDSADRGPAGSVADIPGVVETLRRAGHGVHWRIEGPLRPLPDSVELACFRIVQEALTNAAKYGEGEIHASVSQHRLSLVLEISNSIRGDVMTGPAGHGLIGMRERVANLGGTLSARAYGRRYIVRAELPTDESWEAP